MSWNCSSMLVDKSLVVAEESWERGARYRLLEPVRQYAWEKLEAERGRVRRSGVGTPSSSSPWPKRPSRSSRGRGRWSGWTVWRPSTTTSGQRSRGRSNGV